MNPEMREKRRGDCAKSKEKPIRQITFIKLLYSSIHLLQCRSSASTFLLFPNHTSNDIHFSNSNSLAFHVLSGFGMN
jgi:hypothetical protein